MGYTNYNLRSLPADCIKSTVPDDGAPLKRTTNIIADCGLPDWFRPSIVPNIQGKYNTSLVHADFTSPR